MKKIFSILKTFVNFIFPKTCISCSKYLSEKEDLICNECLLHLPYTDFENKKNNMVEKMFYGKLCFREAAAIFFFVPGGRLQHILHALKYMQEKRAASILSSLIKDRLELSSRFDNIDYIIPIPIHEKKLKIRSYNQAEILAQNIDKTKCLGNVLLKIKHNESQTKKNRDERQKNVENAYALNPNFNTEQLENKHVLLLDDVITTGATIESAATELLKIKGIELSLLAVATPA